MEDPEKGSFMKRHAEKEFKRDRHSRQGPEYSLASQT
jgi:hypothetical protein